MKTNIILQGDALTKLKELPDKSINMVMTSPPYWALRDYGIEGQLGLESTFDEYINNLCNIFDEVKRVLRDDGVMFVNIGDCYAGNMGKKSGWTDNKLGFEKEDAIKKGVCLTKKTKIIHQLPQKCLVGIPARFQIEMLNRGWILRNTIIWYKPSCMPSSAKDRFTIDFEYVFFFIKNKKYYFNQQFEPLSPVSIKDITNRKNMAKGTGEKGSKHFSKNSPYSASMTNRSREEYYNLEKGRNKRCIWKINTAYYSEAHFATYPEELCETPIKAGCPKDGIVLDPFFGAGTTGLVALKQGKRFIGIELNPEYIEIAEKRIKPFMEQTKLK